MRIVPSVASHLRFSTKEVHTKRNLLTIGVNVRIEGMDELLALLRRDANEEHPHHNRPRLTGGKIVIIVQDSQADVAYSISGISAVDAKGDAVDNAALTIAVVSTDASVVAVTPDPTDQTKGSAKFGNPGLATINVTVNDASGTMLGSFAQSFTVTTGPITAIKGGTIAFEGLSDVPPAPPVTDPNAPPASPAAP